VDISSTWEFSRVTTRYKAFKYSEVSLRPLSSCDVILQDKTSNENDIERTHETCHTHIQNKQQPELVRSMLSTYMRRARTPHSEKAVLLGALLA